MTDVEQSGPWVSRFEDAFERVLPEIEAFPESELAAMNVDVPQAVISALGAWQAIASLRERVARELPELDLARFDKIETYALATGHAHVLYMAASSPAGLQALVEEAAQLRELLYSDAMALSKRGLLDRQQLKQLKGPQGYRNLAFDLLTLAAMMREKWSELEGRTALQLNELTHASQLAYRLIQAVGARERGASVVLEATNRRRKAFSLFAKAYDQARRAVTFLRWEQGDVESISPSLYAGRGGSKRRVVESVEAAASAGFALGSSEAVGTGSGSESRVVQGAGVGLPGGSPFTAS